MAEQGNRCSNERLRHQRKVRGWTLDDVADGLHRLAHSSEAAELGVDAHMVGRWERGVRRPAPRYVGLLSKLFELPATQLGLVNDPLILSEPEDDDVQRRQFLQYLSLVSGSSMIDWDRLGGLLQGAGTADSRLLDDLEALTKNYARQIETMAPASLYPALRSHLSVLTGTLQTPQPDTARHRLQSLAGQTAMITGAVAWLQENRGEARQLWSFARQTARDSGDDTLLALALTRLSFFHSRFPGMGQASHSPHLAIAMLDSAESYVGPESPPYARIFVLLQRAEEHASAGDAPSTNRDLNAAGEILGGTRGRDDGMFVHWDNVRFDGYRGSCAIQLRQPQRAREILEPALKKTSPTLARQTCAVLSDLGAAYADEHEVEQSCDYLERALEPIERNGLHLYLHRVLSSRAHLDRWADYPAVRRLDERLLAV